jgi:hypothetical protein
MIPAYKEKVDVAKVESNQQDLSTDQRFKFLEEQILDLKIKLEYYEREHMRMKNSIQQVSEHLSRGR